MTAAQAMERRNAVNAIQKNKEKTMNYSELKEVMHNFRTGRATRAEMVAAFALWQRPVDCAPDELKKAAIEAVIR